MYYSIVYLYLIDGITLWVFMPRGNASKILMTKLKLSQSQKNIIRMISAAKYSTDAEPLFKFLKILLLEDIYQHQIVN